MEERELDPGVRFADFGRPMPGERVSGDVAVAEFHEGNFYFCVVDVLGHGPAAHSVAQVAERFLRANWTPSVTRMIMGLHEALLGGRGAAVGVGVLDVTSGRLVYSGVGNTVFRLLGPNPVRFYSREGVVGERISTIQEQSASLDTEHVAVLYTDGVRASFELDAHPHLLSRPLSTLSRTLVEDFGKDFDDATCLSFRRGT